MDGPLDRGLKTTVKTVFFGTPGIGVGALKALAQTTSLVGVVCQPDRPAGRGMQNGILPHQADRTFEALAAHEAESTRSRCERSNPSIEVDRGQTEVECQVVRSRSARRVSPDCDPAVQVSSASKRERKVLTIRFHREIVDELRELLLTSAAFGDGNRALGEHRPSIQPFVHLHQRYACLLVTSDDSPLDRRPRRDDGAEVRRVGTRAPRVLRGAHPWADPAVGEHDTQVGRFLQEPMQECPIAHLGGAETPRYLVPELSA